MMLTNSYGTNSEGQTKGQNQRTKGVYINLNNVYVTLYSLELG